MARQTPASLPLLGAAGQPELDGVVAWRHGRAITRARFLHDVLAVARALPDHAHVINVCDDRYLFMVGFAAAVVRRQVSLLPPSRVAGVVVAIAADYPDTYLLVDGPVGDGALPQFRMVLDSGLTDAPHAPQDPPFVPLIDAEQLVAILFTSGSTGQAMPNRKTWGALVTGAAGHARALLPDVQRPLTVVATVPSQHMYGFETTIMLPLLGYCAVQCDRPLYADDVRRALEQTPESRMLITTPVHLRAFAEYTGIMPALELILCATAPLTTSLAAACEEKFTAPVKEAFGCTEAGIMATRYTTRDEPWTLLSHFVIEARADGTLVHGDHLVEPVFMQDVIELQDERRFRLIGRGTDLVNIAGKRASLGDLNTRLLSIEGVRDGVIFMPEAATQEAGAVVRTAAFVVAPGMTREQVLAALRQLVDPAFLPRPLLLVDALPRSESSKLPRAAVLKLFAEQTRS